MNNFAIKIQNLIKLTIGLLPATLLILYKKIFFKEIVLVSLFSSKFGHFYSNTENFLRKKYKKNFFFIFYPEVLIDNKYMLEEWKKKIFIVPNFIGYTLYKFHLIFNIMYCNCRDFSAIDRKSFLNKSFLTKKRKPLNNFFTCSIRISNYQKKYQLKSNNYQDYRDTNLKDFKLAISKFLKKKKLKAALINSDAKKLIKKSLKNKNFKLNNSNKFENLLDLISLSKFHFGASTGVDTVAFSHNIPTGLFNMMLGSPFNFINYPSKCIIAPSLLIDKKNKKILKLKKYIELIKYMEKKFQKDRFDFDDQIKFKVSYKKSSEDEMYNLLNEIYLLSIDRLKLTKKQKNLQKKFWKLYPNIQREVLTKQILSDQKQFKPLISPYFLNKYENLIF